MIRVWTAQGLYAMVMWQSTLRAQWRYHHTAWNALDLNARPRGCSVAEKATLQRAPLYSNMQPH